ncbi:MAG: SLBB domain-containing protein, partial [Armatimonadota bacterium]
EYQRTIDTSGNIYVPGAGTLRAAQKTCEQLQQAIVAAIHPRFKQLRVGVAVESMATMLVQVAGDVARPGAYVLSGMPTVMSALYQAGGPTKSGTFRRVELTRVGQPKRIVDLYEFVLKGNKDQDLPLEDGDLVFVPPVGPTIAVEGDVVRPARYEPDFPITLGDALKMAGGIKATGLHTVQVERVENNECRVLLNEPITVGEGKSGFLLKPGDIVTVMSVRPDRTNQVSITGPVSAPGLYGFTQGMRVGDLIKLAQGLDPKQEVYLRRADILRTDPLKGIEILTLDLEQALAGDPAHNLELQKLDQVFIYQPDQVVFRPRVVTILGAVARPGTYKRTDGMRVSDAIAAAGGLMPEAYLERADLIRHASDGSTELIQIALERAMSGDPTANLKLADRDELTVREYSDVRWASRVVRIEGAVQRPGVYVRSKNMRVSDLLFAAGGLLPEASEQAEVARQTGGGESKIFKVPNVASLVAGGPEDLLLEDRDVVTIPAKNPSLRAPEIVFVTGEVARPGPYALNGRNERLIDVIKRAGGLTKDADPRGTLFLRQKESFENSQQERDVDLILKKTRAFADKQFLTQLAKLGVPLPAETIQAVQPAGEALAKPVRVVAEEKLEKEVTSPEQQTLPGPEALEKTVQAGQLTGATVTRSSAGASARASVGAAVPSGQPAQAVPASALGP